MEIKDHILTGDPNVSFSALNEFAPFAEGKLDTIIIHYTAGSGMASALNALKARKLSAHVVLDKVAPHKIVQLVHFNRVAAHAGTSSFLLDGKQRTSFNYCSIGIEIDNAGPISLVDGKFYTWYNKPQKLSPLQPSEVFTGKHRNKVTTGLYWAPYPASQIQRVYELCRVLCKTYPIKYILGHEEICPGVKSDPGPAFPLDQMRLDLFNEKMPYLRDPLSYGKVLATPPDQIEHSEIVSVISGTLNIRSGPGTNNPTVAPPLQNGTKLQVLQVAGDWLKVNFFTSVGWVAKQYIDPDNTDEKGDGIVNVNLLNVRTKPDGDILTELKKDTKVDVLKQEEGWLMIGLGKKGSGFVAKQYVKTV